MINQLCSSGRKIEAVILCMFHLDSSVSLLNLAAYALKDVGNVLELEVIHMPFVIVTYTNYILNIFSHVPCNPTLPPETLK